MRYLRKILLLFLILSLTPLSVYADSQSSLTTQKEMRGLWVATVVNIDYPVKPTTDSEVLKSEALKILNNAQSAGFNAIFLQVRPTADALYSSNIFPWSKYLTGKQGVAPSNGFDPLAFWITEAHKRGMELHAWLNPYRVTKKSANEPNHDFASLAAANPALLFPNWIVKHSDGNLYFNPGIPEVRQLIVLGVQEIIMNYDVDGIHFDDYFYPDKTFSDSPTYELYKKPGQSLDDWRRENVNMLIRDVYSAIKATKKNVRFGVSPFGIWANKSSNPLGSDTKGLESYYSHYADSRYWVKEGILDYITPQIYWNIGYSVADYSKLVSWWRNVVSGTNVDLYIGQAAYKAGSTDKSSVWYGTAEIERQILLNRQYPEVKGGIFFSYNSFLNTPALFTTVGNLFKQGGNGSSGNGSNGGGSSGGTSVPVSIARPSGNITTSLSSFYLCGTSDPTKPLYLNGSLVENRSVSGYYGVLVPLSEGANSFTLTQGTSSASCVITRSKASATSPLSKADIPSTSTFPQAQEYRMPGEKITLSCVAPSGSKVTVALNGKTYTMTTKATGASLNPATYTYEYTIPSYTGTPRVIDLGIPTYTMNYNGTVKTAKAPAKIGIIMKGAPYYAEVTEPVIDTYDAPVTGNGASYELYSGMVDAITGMTGSYARLSTGQWVFKSKVKIYTAKAPLQSAVKKSSYITGEEWDTLKLDLSAPAAAISSFDGTTLKLTVTADAGADKVTLPANGLISAASVSKTDNGAVYSLTVRTGEIIEGYCVEKTGSGVELKIKRKVRVIGGEKPLKGITIIVDPGHGGSESGAIGPLGMAYAEKDINLKLGLKLQKALENMGATVLLTRTTDATVSLADRLTGSRLMKPDLFISLHANSMEDNVDISKVNGFSVFYREALAKPISDVIYNQVTDNLARKKMGVTKKNFYVTRGTWTPSILIETGFVPNPGEFEWLISEKSQEELAGSIANGILQYFTH